MAAPYPADPDRKVQRPAPRLAELPREHGPLFIGQVHPGPVGHVSIMGPEACTVLGALTDADLDDDAFPWLDRSAVPGPEASMTDAPGCCLRRSMRFETADSPPWPIQEKTT